MGFPNNRCWNDVRIFPDSERCLWLVRALCVEAHENWPEAHRRGAGNAGGDRPVRLLILTGCRLNEILTLTWQYVDLNAGTLNLPDSKTGAKVVHIG